MNTGKLTLKLKMPGGILMGSVLVICRYPNGKYDASYFYPKPEDYDRLLSWGKKPLRLGTPDLEPLGAALWQMGWSADFMPPTFEEHPLLPAMWDGSPLS